jgi:hypothetical protein
MAKVASTISKIVDDLLSTRKSVAGQAERGETLLHRPVCMASDGFSDTAHKESVQKVHPMRLENNLVCAPILGGIEDCNSYFIFDYA